MSAFLGGGSGGSGGGGYKIVQITTGASPIVIDPTVYPTSTLFQVTTGGTGGNEQITLVDFSDPNLPAAQGVTWVFQVVTQTNPSDTVTINNPPANFFYDNVGNPIVAYTGHDLDVVNSSAGFFFSNLISAWEILWSDDVVYTNQITYPSVHFHLNQDNLLITDNSIVQVASLTANGGVSNVGIGYGVFTDTPTSASFNTSVGSGALGNILVAQSNAAFGYHSLQDCDQTGNGLANNNTALGNNTLADLIDGAGNTGIGGGGNSIFNGNNNIVIAADTPGDVSNYLNIGDAIKGDMTVALGPTVPWVPPSYDVATLPNPATVGAGAAAFVTDSAQTIAAGLGTNPVGGGNIGVPVYSDGTQWLIG